MITNEELREWLDRFIEKHNELQENKKESVCVKKRPGGETLPNPFPVVYYLKAPKNEGE